MRKISKNNASWDAVYSRLIVLKGYDTPWVREYLAETYNHKCPFCEGKPEDTSTFNIEHFYPQMDYDLKTDLHNLHYSCSKCNDLKHDSYNRKILGKPHTDILSPNYYLNSEGQWIDTTQEFLKKNLMYVGHLLFSPINSDFGKKTIEAFNLNNDDKSYRRNRESLIESRLEILTLANKTLVRLQKKIDKLLLRYDRDDYAECLEYVDVLAKMVSPEAKYSEMVVDNIGESIKSIFEYFKSKVEEKNWGTQSQSDGYIVTK